MTTSRIGICSWSLRPDSPRVLVEALQRVEIDAVQLALVPVVSDPSTWGDAVRTLSSAGIKVLSGMMSMEGEDYSTLDSIRATGGLRPDGTWETNRRNAEAVAALAASAGIGLVTFHAGFLPGRREDSTRRVMVERLHAVADIFAARGVDVALETGQESGETLLDVVEEIWSTSEDTGVGVNFDPANMILYGNGDPVEALGLLSDYVRQVHVKDALPAGQRGAWGTEVPVGSGAVDWDGFFEVATAIPAPINFVIEREAGACQDGDLTTARMLVQRQLLKSKAER